MTRNVLSPSVSNGGSVFFRTPAEETMQTVASARSPLNGVQGMQCRESSGWSTREFPLLQLLQRLEDLVRRRLLGDVVNVDVGDLALLIDDEDRSLGDARIAQRVVLERHHAVGEEIG